MEINFPQLNQRLLDNVSTLLFEWLPGGKPHGKEYMCGSLRGGPGDSMRVNMDKGVWCDFATDDKGGDLVSLFAAIEGISQYESGKTLQERFNMSDKPKALIVPKPRMLNATASWEYTDKAGNTLFYMARYETLEGKQFSPWSLDSEGVWVRKAYHEPRPLYNLKDIADNPKKPILVCYYPDTELLTKNGWKRIDRCTLGDEVAQYNIGNESVSFVNPLAWQEFDFSGYMVNIVSNWCDLMVTPDHRIVVRKKESKKKGGLFGRPRVCTADDFIYCDKMPNSGFRKGKDINLNENQARLITAIQADGRFPPKSPWVDFNFKKKRKIDRLIGILDNLKIKYILRFYKSQNGWTHVLFKKKDVPFVFKHIPNKKFHFGMLNWDENIRKVIIEELGYWDGDFTGKQGIRYFTSDKINADVISSMASITGYGCILRNDDRDHRKNSKRSYILNINRKRWRGFCQSVGPEKSNPKKYIDYTGKVYCCTVPDGFLVTRRNGKTVIAGNCEGEKCVDAAQKIVGDRYVVTTWSNGTQSWNKTYWNDIQDRNVLIWPDADESGINAADKIAQKIVDMCTEVKIIDPSDKPNKWDAADAVEDGWNWEIFKCWAKENVSKVVKAEPEIEVEEVKLVPVEDIDLANTSSIALWEQLGVPSTKNGQPICSIMGCNRIMQGIPKYNKHIWFDEFHKKIFTDIIKTGKNTGGVREWNDIDDLAIAEFMQEELALHRMTDDMCHRGLRLFAQKDLRNEPRDWMNSLEWDGSERIETFLIDCLGCKNTEYTRAISRNFWITTIARVFNPGCQVDNMIVLEGSQGTGKTTALRIIGGKWHTEAQENIMSKDFFQALHGKLIVEISELSSFPRAEIQRIKQVVSCNTDRYRAPYDRSSEDHPRMSVFVGTTNESKYLHDATGGRRFWPVECGYIDNKRLLETREQLFAEAVVRFKTGDSWHLVPIDETLAEQNSRRQSDEWESLIYLWLKGRSEVTVMDVGQECIKIEIAKLDMSTQRRISTILSRLKWVNREDNIWVSVAQEAEIDF